MSVFYSSGFKKYQSEIPSDLRSRPKIIVDEILKKMGTVSPEMIISIKSVLHVPEETYIIEGNSMHGTEKKVYHVSFGTHEICVSCSSPCFRRNRSLCKHSFAINDSGYRSFEDLTSLYRNHPWWIFIPARKMVINCYLLRQFIISRSCCK